MAAPQTTKQGEIVPRAEQKPADRMSEIVKAMTPQISQALPKHMTGDRMARIVLTAVRMNPKLGECTPASFIGCVLACAQLGLEPNTPLGLAYLIPRKNNKNGGRLECSLQIGYMGMTDLADRAGVDVFAYAVRKGDIFEYELGMDPKMRHVLSDSPDRQKQPITHAYCVSVSPSGLRKFTVLTVAQIEERRARSGSAIDGPWVTDYEPMCCKTAVRAHFKWMPKSTEKTAILATAAAIDEAPEIGVPLLSAVDPMIANAMESQGLIETEGEPSAN